MFVGLERVREKHIGSFSKVVAYWSYGNEEKQPNNCVQKPKVKRRRSEVILATCALGMMEVVELRLLAKIIIKVKSG